MKKSHKFIIIVILLILFLVLYLLYSNNKEYNSYHINSTSKIKQNEIFNSYLEFENYINTINISNDSTNIYNKMKNEITSDSFKDKTLIMVYDNKRGNNKKTKIITVNLTKDTITKDTVNITLKRENENVNLPNNNASLYFFFVKSKNVDNDIKINVLNS